MATNRTQKPIHLHSPAVDFVDTRLPRYHPVFVDPGAFHDDFTDQLGASFQAHIDRFDPMFMGSLSRRGKSATAPVRGSKGQAPLGASLALPISQELPVERPLPPDIEAMKFWKPIWPKAMASLGETKEAPGRQDKGFSIRKAETWKDVEDVLTRARDKYDNFGRQGSWVRKTFGKMKKRGRDVGGNVAGPIKQIAKMVPSSDIASPVIGAVNLLMNAWQEAIKAGKEFAASFDSTTLEHLFAGIEFHSGMHRGDQNIINASTVLLTTVFKAVEGAIGFYISWQASRLGQAIFQGDVYVRSLRDSLKKIKSDEEILEKQAGRSFQCNVQQQLRVMSVRATQHFFFLLEELESKSQGIKPLPRKKNLFGPEVVSIHSTELGAPTPEPNTLYTVESLLEALNSTDVDETDIEAVFNRAGAFPEQDRARAEQVVGTSAFRNWVVTRGPTKLLVHGDYDDTDYPEVSPLSALSAALVQAVRTRPDFVTLVFFCGRHLNRRRGNNDLHTGANGLMRSLIAQILQQCPSACPSQLSPDISLSDIEDGDLDALARLFTIVACQLPASKTLVVFIDGVQLYERNQFRQGLHQVVNKLVELADDEGPMQSTLKLFLSSPWQTRTKELYRMFSGDQAILSMEAMQDTGQGLSRNGIAKVIVGELDHRLEEDPEK